MLIATTPRLEIRPWTLEDAPAALAMLSRIEVVQWLGDGDPVLTKDLDEARMKVETWRGRDNPPLGHWAVEVTDGGPLHGRTIGTVLLLTLPNDEHGEVEIGWHLHPDAWGNGYAPEAATAILERGFSGGIEEIFAVTDLDNVNSMKVCTKIGMEHRGTIDKWYATPSQFFVITREQWLAQQAERT
ncbi:GNAT family N-acetyltransferase [Nocardioides marmorisolisilvae]|uniref:GNAT family N-acetyltransferase n=1 Tax=Nocardioides marmorisolisilvae TaxID=1542737 RepID=UPI001620AD79|nr:GNAT family N-acetyltransferase [Nocardioides marmorisolisilvae]